tara:strand:- start:45 stop:908 length:864 start_codon:yes stop_codon:yes gene_type:complete
MGRWGAVFDGASNDNELKVDNYTNSFGVSSAGQQKYTIFCSAYWDGGDGGDTMFAIGRTDTNRNVAYHPRYNNNANHYHFSADTNYSSFYWYDQETRTLALRYAGGGSNSTNMKKWLDATTYAGSGSTSGGLDLENNYPLRIGGYSTRGSDFYYEGRIFNFIALRTDRTDSEVTDITGKLNTYTDDKFTTDVVSVITFESGKSFPDSEWNWVFRHESGSWGGDIVYRLASKSNGAFEGTNRRIRFRSGETPKVWTTTSDGYWDGTIYTTGNYVSSNSLRFRSPYDLS